MLHFNESFSGGFFGFWRTYGAVARSECQSEGELETDWPAILRETAAWRLRRGERATSLHLFVQILPGAAWGAVDFLSRQLLVPPATRPLELQGLHLEVAVFDTTDTEQYFDLILYAVKERGTAAAERGANPDRGCTV